jgi:hypothetical protein
MGIVGGLIECRLAPDIVGWVKPIGQAAVYDFNGIIPPIAEQPGTVDRDSYLACLGIMGRELTEGTFGVIDVSENSQAIPIMYDVEKLIDAFLAQGISAAIMPGLDSNGSQEVLDL